MKQFFTTMFAVIIACAFAVSASAGHIRIGQDFQGGWIFDNNSGGSEYLLLGDNNGWGLELRGSERFCGKRGASYQTMRNYIASNYPEPVFWYVDDICNDGYVRVCVESGSGRTACSTYRDRGWKRF